jgi:hypothetical protein
VFSIERKRNSQAKPKEVMNFEDMLARGEKYKRVIASADCCIVCQANRDQGLIPVEHAFASGQARLQLAPVL